MTRFLWAVHGAVWAKSQLALYDPEAAETVCELFGLRGSVRSSFVLTGVGCLGCPNAFSFFVIKEDVVGSTSLRMW